MDDRSTYSSDNRRRNELLRSWSKAPFVNPHRRTRHSPNLRRALASLARGVAERFRLDHGR